MFAQSRMSGYGHLCAVTGSLQRLFVVYVAAFMLCFSSCVVAEPGSFQVEEAHSWTEEGAYFLDAQFVVNLSSGAFEALENGVPLVFVLQFQVVKTHPWFWDVVDIEINQVRQIQYHALSRSYLVKESAAGTQGNYHRLKDALQAAGAIEGLFLTDQELEQGRGYKMRVRGSLDIESLPTPVRLLAYVSSSWDMDSEWYTWPLAR
jgi:hypothetical protein